MKSRIIIWLFALTSIYINSNKHSWDTNIYTYDVQGYYMYLPALFIKHDIKNVYRSTCDQEQHIYDKYPLGIAISELPFFLIAHAYCDKLGYYEPTGYTLPYQLAGIGATLFWVVIGLYVLRRFLLLYFDDWVVTIGLLCISFGTNMYTYTVFNPGMSHPFSFFLFSAILLCTARWHITHRAVNMYTIGLLLGLTVITRPINIIIMLFPLLWGVSNLILLKERMKLLLHYRAQVIISFMIFMIICFVQMFYWKYRQGSFLLYSYGNEGFDFIRPKILMGLFSFRKGWFIYTPMAMLIAAGFYTLPKKFNTSFPVIILYTLLAIYLTFSWKNWWYGGGFSCRPLIESMAVFSIPLCSLSERVIYIKKKLALFVVSVLIITFITLNIFQSYQYSLGILHYDRMTMQYYEYIFGKTKIDNSKAEKLLMSDEEVWRAVEEMHQ